MSNTAVTLTILSTPSNSKGWGQVSIARADGRPALKGRTVRVDAQGRAWVGAGKPRIFEAVDGEVLLITMQVMLRVGKGATARQEITTETCTYLVGAPATIFELRPGSQGLRVSIG